MSGVSAAPGCPSRARRLAARPRLCAGMAAVVWVSPTRAVRPVWPVWEIWEIWEVWEVWPVAADWLVREAGRPSAGRPWAGTAALGAPAPPSRFSR
ncbi:hypothetical protein [Peterkaempfera bronchialis]|uniref:hypothetical protein n=1 Tax=Peterkaempfera bronchialis TaxID=2126346 RepID=UPI001E3AB7CD|nr:hypothetical protein [Peterkaempfera bronchialis]